MEKTLAQLVKEYLAQPLQDTFQYSDIPDVTSTTKEKEEEEEKIKKPIVYIPPSGDGGGGIGSLGGGDGTFIGGGATLEDAGGTYPGGYHSAEGGLEFTGGDGEITADGPGYGTMGTTGYGSGQDLGGGEITADGPGYGTMGTGIGGMGLGEVTADGPGFGSLGTGIGGGQGLGADANDGFAGGQGFGGYEGGAFADDATGSDTSPGATGGEGGFDDGSFGDANTGDDTSPGATGGEGGSPGGGGGTHCCTAANERGDMTLTEVKKLRAWHRKQSKIWQRGYDVWGRVMADNLVSKYKWSSDRVRDFYNHKIYGKRTIGSTFADFCIYPMSMIIGFILTVMPPILGYQENKKHGKSSS